MTDSTPGAAHHNDNTAVTDRVANKQAASKPMGGERAVETADIAIVGSGLAGSEAAWQLARRGLTVDLFEMRPERPTEAHRTGLCAELVCSNSFKSLNQENAHGLLKAELSLQGSLVLQVAETARIPAGQALAVDRDLFAVGMTERLEAHPRIRLQRREITDLAPLLSVYNAVVVATGPLTSSALAENLKQYVGESTLYFHDAIAPVVVADSIDTSVAYRASRYDKGSADYLNCPMNQAQYRAFVQAVAAAEKVAFHEFEHLRAFEGCLPIEVMVERGEATLAFGPFKPVGLPDPRTGKDPHAVLQLRQEDRRGTLYGLVGCQTKMTWPEQRRIFRMIPGLEQAEFARLGSLHRNTFLNAPTLLDPDLALREEPRLFFAGQITGVEGYIESTAMGLYVAKRIVARLAASGKPHHPPGERPSSATMTGALVRYLLDTPPKRFQPMNASFGLLDLPGGKMKKQERKAYYAKRALAEMSRLENAEPDAHPNTAPQATT